VWPPSNPGLGMPWCPVRAFWPFWPLPAVLCRPEPWPRPRRFLFRVAPGFGFSVCSVVPISLLRASSAAQPPRSISISLFRRLDLHQMRDLADHAADRRGIVQQNRLVHPRQAQPADGLLLIGRAIDARADQRDFE